jgi:hypothetical protein
LHDIDFRWKFSARDCLDDLYFLGLEGKELFSYAIANCTIFSMPPDGIDVSQFKCNVNTIPTIPTDQCEMLDDSELLQLCDNNMCMLCII